jgi:hypothetical protein
MEDRTAAQARESLIGDWLFRPASGFVKPEPYLAQPNEKKARIKACLQGRCPQKAWAIAAVPTETKHQVEAYENTVESIILF